MKAVLISIQPQWCEKIFNGEKTIEVRKNRPQIETPFKCYVYCSKWKTFLYKNPNNGELFLDSNGGYRGGDYEDRFLTQKVIGEFVCDRIRKIIPFGLRGFKLGAECLKEMCLSKEQLDEYGGLKTLCGWHITEPKLFDKPRELGEFSKFGYKYLGGFCVNYNCLNCIDNGWMQPPECKIDGCLLTRPPQSWCYVEEN